MEIKQKLPTLRGVLNLKVIKMSEKTYLSFNPETNEFTKDHEYVNSWKWEDPTETEFRKDDQKQKAACDRYDVPYSTPPAALAKIKRLKDDRDRHSENYNIEAKKNTEFLNSLETAAIEIKHLRTENKELKKAVKKKLKELEPYLRHKETCQVSILEIVGRAKVKSKCTCGLSSLIA